MDYSYNKEVRIPIGKVRLEGELIIPLNTGAIVVFSHGSGSSRMSPRNRMVAHYLHEHHIGTLLFDLLTAEEDVHYHNRFDIELLTKRLAGATEWLGDLPAAKKSRIGYFGASTGAAAALKAAAILPKIGAVVSRGGRPDLAMESLPKIEAPVLLIVGGLDHDVLKMNEVSYMQLACEKKLEIIPGATHLFEERGAMDQVAALAAAWFEKYLQPATVHH